MLEWTVQHSKCYIDDDSDSDYDDDDDNNDTNDEYKDGGELTMKMARN